MKVDWPHPLITKSIQPGWARVVCAWSVWIERLGGTCVTVEAGFEFDWDSVPRIPGVHALLKGRAEKSACLHDWLYRYQPCSRKTADLIFLDAMVEEGVAWRHRQLIYWGVRSGGSLAWRGRATSKEALS